MTLFLGARCDRRGRGRGGGRVPLVQCRLIRTFDDFAGFDPLLGANRDAKLFENVQFEITDRDLRWVQVVCRCRCCCRLIFFIISGWWWWRDGVLLFESDQVEDDLGHGWCMYDLAVMCDCVFWWCFGVM